MSEIEMTGELAVEAARARRLEAASLPLSESARRQIVNLIFVVFWLLIFEGALRKWVFPDYQRALFFVRDPFVATIYFLSLKDRVWPRTSLFTMLALFMAWLGAGLIVVELFSGVIFARTEFLLAIYGWREYFWNIPLAFVIGECFSRDDLTRLFKYTLLVSIPIAVLCFFQSSAGEASILNAGGAENPANLFSPLGVGLGFMRANGTFTSTEGQSLFIGSLAAISLWVWIVPKEMRPLKGVALMAAGAAVLTNLAVSGQRQAFVLTLVIMTAALAGTFMLPSGRLQRRNLLRTAGLAAARVLIAPFLFPGHLHALAVRATGPSVGAGIDIYGLANRAWTDLTHFADLLPGAPILGYGFGVGGNAVGMLDPAVALAAEDDWSRNIIDLGPVFGVVFIMFRVALVMWLAASAVRTIRRRGDLLPFLLCAFTSVMLLDGQITGQGTVNGFGWLFLGFSIAANETAAAAEVW